MRLTQVSLPAMDPGRAARWYADVLGLEVSEHDGTWRIAIGTDVVILRQQAPQEATDGVHHLAFGIPVTSFAASKAWLRERVELASLDGEDEFEGPGGWNSRSLYVEGPEASVLELIARRDLPDARSGPGPGPGPELSLSEVGIAVSDVRGTARRLQTELGVAAYDQAPTDDFAAVGDIHGLLVLVAEGRRWYPLNQRYARAAEIEVGAVDERSGTISLGGGRLTLTAATAP